MNLIIFTSTYPYVRGGEQNFLDIEIQYLLNEFDNVVIVPEKVEGARFGKQGRAEVDLSYAKYLDSRNIFVVFLKGLFSPIFYQGMKEKNFPKFSIKAFRRLFAFAGKAQITSQWVKRWFRSRGVDDKDCLFYTYWFDQASAGISLAKKQFPELKLISRAHGYDVYEEQYYDPPFWPCRHTVLKSVEKVFPASMAGRNYFSDHYPEFSGLFETAFLGVQDPGFLNQISKDGVFRIISCSMIRPEKRVERILNGVLQAAKLRPEQLFEWTHIGNGPKRDELQGIANDTFPANAKAYFTGYSDNDVLMQLYRDKPFDVFINMSETEGTPVSIMEAISCGIPVIATAVGGNIEIVSKQNGIYLSQDPSLDEISAAIFHLIDHPREAGNKREGSRLVWQTQYDAQINFSEFAKKLKSIRLGS